MSRLASFPVKSTVFSGDFSIIAALPSFGRTYQYGFGDECFPFFGDGKGFINSGCILQNLSGQDGNGGGGTCGDSRFGSINCHGKTCLVHAG